MEHTDGVVDTAARVRAGRPGIRFLSGQIFSLLPKRRDRVWGPHKLVFNGNRGSIPGVKWPGREVDHTSPLCVEVKNECLYTYISLVSRGKGKLYLYLEHDTLASCKFRSCSAG
jgi:hypothetical protein